MNIAFWHRAAGKELGHVCVSLPQREVNKGSRGIKDSWFKSKYRRNITAAVKTKEIKATFAEDTGITWTGAEYEVSFLP